MRRDKLILFASFLILFCCVAKGAVLTPVITSATTASGKVGSAFTYQITASNTPTSYGATGLPAGLSINSRTGLISGTPTAAGASTVTLGATNRHGTGKATLTLTIVAAAPVITSATTASGTVGSAFSYQITASNTPTSYGATGLPAGLTVNSGTGLISGTPTAAGTSTVTLSASNSGGTGNATLTLTIVVLAPVITSATTASGTVGRGFSYQITASNAPASYGATGLPPGLTVNGGTGLISGTPTAAGTSTVTLSATNSAGTGSATLTLTIAATAAITRNAHGVTDVGATSTASPITVSLSNVAAGDLIVCEVSLEEGVTFTSVSDPSNGKYSPAITLHTNTTMTQQMGIYYVANAVAGSYSVSLAWTGGATNYQAMACQSWTGVGTSSPQDTTMTEQQDGSSTANPTAGSTMPPAAAGELIIGNVATSAYVPTAGTYYTLTDSASTTYLWPEYWIQTTATATNAPYTNSSDKWTDQMVAFKPASSLTVVAPVITSATTASGTVGSAFSYQITATNAPSSYGATGLPAGLSINTGTGLISGTPTGAGTSTVTLSATNSGGTGNATLTLTIAASAAVASLSPSGLTFASQAVGVTSTAQTVTLKNTGNAALSITGLALAGTNAGDFAQTNNCGASVAAGANCTINVTFTPAASGTFTAAVTLTDNATGSPQTVSLSGTGASAGAGANVSPSSLAFGNEPVDMTSSSQTVTLNNTGSAALSITSISFTGADPADFSEVNTCSPSVAAGGTCTIVILFTPSASGARTASLSITDNFSGSPQSVALSGTGTHDVILTWTEDSPAVTILGYNIYRGTTPGGESSTPLNTSPVPGATFTDVNVQAGQTYYYVLTAVSAEGNTQSADSKEVSATVP